MTYRLANSGIWCSTGCIVQKCSRLDWRFSRSQQRIYKKMLFSTQADGPRAPWGVDCYFLAPLLFPSPFWIHLKLRLKVARICCTALSFFFLCTGARRACYPRMGYPERINTSKVSNLPTTSTTFLFQLSLSLSLSLSYSLELSPTSLFRCFFRIDLALSYAELRGSPRPWASSWGGTGSWIPCDGFT